jgi:hypothetical protein
MPRRTTQDTICEVCKNHHATPMRCINLGGTIDDAADTNDDMAEPLGLSGAFTVRGLDTTDCDNGDIHLPRQTSPGQQDSSGQYVVLPTWVEHEFQVVLSPEMTPFHVMRRAAAEYLRLHGNDRWHIFFESMSIDAESRVIELGMGS